MVVLIRCILYRKGFKSVVQHDALRKAYFIYLFYERKITDDLVQVIDIFCEYPILIGKFYETSCILMCRFQQHTASQWTSELDGLTGTHQLDSQDIFEVIKYLAELPPADAAHAHMI